MAIIETLKCGKGGRSWEVLSGTEDRLGSVHTIFHGAFSSCGKTQASKYLSKVLQGNFK